MKRLVQYLAESANLARLITLDNVDPKIVLVAEKVLYLAEAATDCLMELHEERKANEAD